MDSLQLQISNIFWERDEKRKQFGDPASSFRLVEVLKHVDSPTTVRDDKLSAQLILDRLENVGTESTQSQPTSTLQIVKIDRNRNGKLRIDPSTFRQLFDVCRIDPCVLYLITRGVYGSRHFRSAQPRGRGEYIDTFYINSVSAMVFWAWDRKWKDTKAIVIPRQSNSVDDSVGIFAEFLGTVETQKDLIDRPWFLQFVSAVNLTLWIDIVLENELEVLRKIEAKSGHGPWVTNEPPPDLNELMGLSESTGFSVTGLSNAARHATMVLNLLDIDDLTTPAKQGERPYVDTTSSAGEIEKAREAVKFLRQHVRSREGDIQYLYERAKSQSSTIFNLITQKDTEASLDLAASAKIDSAAMKVIAVMTMFFLPGTFFATLFAVPTLHWSDETVVGDRFWVYWAFTLPATLVILIIYKSWGQIRRLINLGNRRSRAGYREEVNGKA